MSDDQSSEPRVAIDEDSVLARWADWQAHDRARPLAALGAPGRTPMLFVADEILVDKSEQDLLVELQERFGATVLSEAPLLPPAGLRPSREPTREAVQMPARLRLEPTFLIDDAAARLERVLREGTEITGPITATSWIGASLAAIVGEHAAAGRSVGLNVVGSSVQLPLVSAEEGGGEDPFAWQEFAGKSRVVHAWQLIESFRSIRGVSGPVWIAVMDGGFWLDGNGAPEVPPGQPVSDFGPGVLQVNLMDVGGRAGGPNPNKCRDGASCPWHGNAVASVATATVGNNAGAAGAGGTVARPVFLKSDLSTSQVFDCLDFCTAWGIDIVNMSFSIEAWELFFPTSSWDKAFQFATDHGVVVIAAAGNDGEELPDHNVRPATRTPGAITVGALQPDDTARPDSNYGSSVNIWAPGTVHVAPDPDHHNGSLQSGTSIAAPVVAGVAAMMRAVDDTLSSARIREILSQTGWSGTGHVDRGLDAYAAVFAAIGNRLPDEREPNDSAASAAELWPIGPAGSLAPGAGGFTTRSHSGDADWWRFTVDRFSTVRISAEWYQRLSSFGMEVHPDDPESRGPDELIRSGSLAAGTSALTGLLAPGTYRLHILGSGATAYRLCARLTPAALAKDAFEPNDGFESAVRLLFRAQKGPHTSILKEWGPGYLDATLHTTFSFVTATAAVNPDYFTFDVPESSVFAIPRIRIEDTDAPVEVALFNESRAVIQSWPGVRNLEILPPPETTCFLRITGSSATRYSINIGLKVDKDAIPGPLEEEDINPLPDWWGDPLLRLRGRVQHYLIEVGQEGLAGGLVAFQGVGEALSVEFLNIEGAIVRTSVGEASGRTMVDTAGLPAGRYIVRLERTQEHVVRRRVVNLRLASPVW